MVGFDGWNLEEDVVDRLGHVGRVDVVVVEVAVFAVAGLDLRQEGLQRVARDLPSYPRVDKKRCVLFGLSMTTTSSWHDITR